MPPSAWRILGQRAGGLGADMSVYDAHDWIVLRRVSVQGSWDFLRKASATRCWSVVIEKEYLLYELQ